MANAAPRTRDCVAEIEFALLTQISCLRQRSKKKEFASLTHFQAHGPSGLGPGFEDARRAAGPQGKSSKRKTRRAARQKFKKKNAQGRKALARLHYLEMPRA